MCSGSRRPRCCNPCAHGRVIWELWRLPGRTLCISRAASRGDGEGAGWKKRDGKGGRQRLYWMRGAKGDEQGPFFPSGRPVSCPAVCRAGVRVLCSSRGYGSSCTPLALRASDPESSAAAWKNSAELEAARPRRRRDGELQRAGTRTSRKGTRGGGSTLCGVLSTFWGCSAPWGSWGQVLFPLCFSPM